MSSFTYTGAGGLFTRLGLLFKVLRVNHVNAGGNLLTNLNAAIAALTTEYEIAAPLSQSIEGALSAQSAIGQTIRSVAQAMLCKQVNATTPLASNTSISLAITELIRLMVEDTKTVATCTTTATATADAGIIGTGGAVASVLNTDGSSRQNIFVETGELICTASSKLGTATAGSEPFSWSGDYAVSNSLAYNWPGYSGSSSGLFTVDDELSNGLNLLTNSSFETFTVADTPDNWTLQTGAAGTAFLEETTDVLRTGYSGLEIVGNGSTVPALYQSFNSSTGSSSVLRPNTLYGLSLWLKRGVTTGTVNLRVDLADSSDTVLTDDAGIGNRLTIAAGSLTTSFVQYKTTFVTPAVMPDEYKLRISFASAPANTSNTYIDALALAPMTELYAQGPSISLFRGPADFELNDKFAVVMTNDRASSTYGGTWQTAFDRFFDMKAMGLQLPYSGSPNIADTLITA